MNKQKITLVALAAVLASTVVAAPFTAGNIVISRIGDGSAALTSAATAVFLDEYTPAGVLVQSIPMPTSVVGNNRILTNSGSATSEGYLAKSADNLGLTLVGYDAIPGTASVVATPVATVNRVVGWVKADGTVDTTTAITDGYDANNIRSACTVDGTSFWTAGTATSTGGVRWIPFGPGQVTTQLSTTVTNTRVVKIYNGQLYIGTGSGAFKGVNTVGTGLPTSGGQVITLLPGFDGSTSSAASPYDYAFADANTLYVADDRGTAAAGGLQKWTFDGSTWTLQYTLIAGLPGTTGLRGLIVKPDAGGNIIYATSTEATPNSLVSVVDTGALSTFSILATAGANTRFRGLAFTPAATTSTETLAPTTEALALGKGTAGDLSSWAADDNNIRTVCKFFIPNVNSPFIRANLGYVTTKTAPTAISFNVRVAVDAGGTQQITLNVQDKTNSAFVNTSVVAQNTAANTTYNGAVSGTLTNYVGGGGAMTGQIEVKAIGFQTSAFPCIGFDSANMVVTG